MKHAVLVLFLLFPITLCAQERYISWTDFADTYFDEQSSEELQEQLEQLYLHPMNLNTVSRDDLSMKHRPTPYWPIAIATTNFSRWGNCNSSLASAIPIGAI